MIARLLRLIGCAVLALLVLGRPTLWAQASTTVQPLDPVYRSLETLSAAGLVDSMVVGQRSLSRREIGRIVTEAQRNLGRLPHPDATLARLVTQLADEYRDAMGGGTASAGSAPPIHGVLESMQLDAMDLDSPSRPVPPQIPGDANGALINPLLDYDEGQRYANGTTVAWQAYLRASLGSHLSFAARPRLALGDGRDTSVNFAQLTAEQLYGRLQFANVALDVGRDYQFFGQGRDAGILGSDNGPGLDMVRLSSPEPFELPWLFRYAGPTMGTLYVADLGPNQNFPHAQLIGYEASFLPSPRLEIGVHVLDQQGGQGAPGATFLDRVLNATILYQTIVAPGNDFGTIGNKFAGFDARYRIPRAAGLELYIDQAFDDFDLRRLENVLYDDSGYIFGAESSCLLACGRLHLQAEWHYTGLRFYAHTPFTSGVADRGYFVGDALGPRGRAAYLTADIQATSFVGITVAGAYEARDGNQYEATWVGPNMVDFHFLEIAAFPTERRGRLTVTTTFGAPNAATSCFAELGIEQVDDYEFVSGYNRVNGIVHIGWRWKPRP